MTPTAKTNPTTSPDLIREGDILFFAPPVEDGRLAQFAQMAAFVQGAPWMHVAIAGADGGPDRTPTVVGFDQTGDPEGNGLNWEIELKELAWSSTSASAVTALRHPDAGPVIAGAARATVASLYDIPGLLAFAAATQARMFKPGLARQRLIDFASGVVAATRQKPPRHTCVTAVGLALAAAHVQVAVSEPEGPTVDADEVWQLLIVTIDDLYGRVQAGHQGAVGATALEAPLIDDEALKAAWGAGFVQAQFPGLIESTGQYLDLLGQVMLHQAQGGTTPDQMVSAGQLAPRRGIDATVSPAMLRAGLLEAGFDEVS